MKTLITILIIAVLAYMALSFVSWDVNPAHWSAIARTALISVLILVILKPVTDWLKLTTDPEKASSIGVTTRTVSEAEYEQNRQFYQKALSMKVGEFTPEQRQSIQDTLVKAKTLVARLEKEDIQIG